MSAMVYKDPETFRLRFTDIYHYPDKLVDDETLTIEKAGVSESTMMWLEDGKVIIQDIYRISLDISIN
jgi:hypothetical protein